MSRTADDRNGNNKLIGSISGDITLFPALKFKSILSIDREYKHFTSFLDPKKTAYGRSEYGNAADRRSLGTVFVFDNILTYNNNFGKHNFLAMAGTSWTESHWSQQYAGASHFRDGSIKTLNAGNKIDPNGYTEGSEWDIMSFIGRLTYNYNSKYLFTANFRCGWFLQTCSGT